MRKLSVLALVLSVGLCASAAVAVTNGDFEDGTTGWTKVVDNTSGLTGDAFTTRNTVSAYAGESLGIGREGTAYDGPQASWFYQNLAVTQGNTYTVTVSGKYLASMTENYWLPDGNLWAVGARVFLFNGAGPTDVNINPDDYSSYNRIYRANQWLAYWDESDELVNENGVWKDFSFTRTFTALDNFVELRLTIHDKASLNWGPGEDPPQPLGVELVAFDNIDVTGIPEPGSMVAMLSGLVGLVGFGIRRRR